MYNALRPVREVARFAYEPLRDQLIGRALKEGYDVTPGTLSDKLAAEYCDTSERQIRKVRREGLDPYQADHYAVKGLGLHPRDIWGDDWVTAESFFAEALFDREIEEVPEQENVFQPLWWESVAV